MDIDTLWNYDLPAESEQRFHEALSRTSDDAARAELLTQIARAQGLQGQYDAAHVTLDQAEAAIAPEMTRARLRLLLERGRVLNTSGQREASAPLFVEAYELGLAAGEEALAIDAAHMLGIVAPPYAALTWNLTALALAERATGARAQRWQGALYNNMGWAYHDAGRGTDALDAFERGQAWREAHRRGPQDDPGIRIAKWCVARELRALGRVDEALAQQLAHLAELERAGAAARAPGRARTRRRARRLRVRGNRRVPARARARG
jgi:tetratricopeptide (TPR) repeat protein